MPFIDTKISKEISEEKEVQIKKCFGEAISLFPGKSENYLMCNIEGCSHLWFAGIKGDAAFVEVKLFGSVSSDAAERFTAKVCSDISNITSIPSDRIYIRYTSGTDWGWNGSNF